MHTSNEGVASNGQSPTEIPLQALQEGNKLTVRLHRTVLAIGRKIPTRRLLLWFLFGVVFGLAPLVADVFKGLASTKGFHVDHALSTGELFIVSAVLSAGAIGELISAKRNGEGYLAEVAGFFCLLCFFGNVLGYMIVGSVDTDIITALSVSLFLVTVAASSVCMGSAWARHD